MYVVQLTVCLLCVFFYRYIVTSRGMASWPFGQGPASPAAPFSTSSSVAVAMVCAHGAAAHSPGEAYAEPPDEREGLEYSPSTLDTLAQRDVSPSVGRVQYSAPESVPRDYSIKKPTCQLRMETATLQVRGLTFSTCEVSLYPCEVSLSYPENETWPKSRVRPAP